MRTSNSGCEIVYQNDCLELSAEPKRAITNWRAYLAIEKICANRDGKQLIWVNGEGQIHQLDVEASIATNSFSTPFFKRCADPCAFINMCVPQPCDCLTAQWVELPVDEALLTNYMLDAPFQFIYKLVYYDGRESEWSDPSKPYYQSTRGCDIVSGLSRALKLRVPIGNPLVEKIKIAFSNDGQTWFQTDVVEKYKKYNDSKQKWYERDLAELSNYSDIDCAFDYYFYNDKQKIQVDASEVSRVFNPIPRDVQGLINIKEAIGFYNYVQGNCPLDQSEVKKINIDADCQQANVCAPEYATVTIRAIILNNDTNKAGFVYRAGVFGEPDDIAEPAYFGNTHHDLANSYGQVFSGKTRNFIAYIEGTDFWSEMKQWQANNGFTNNQEKDVIALAKLPFTDNELVSLVSVPSAYARMLAQGGSYMYQEAKIKVPKGTKGFIRLVSHHQTIGTGGSQDTSTNITGTLYLPYYTNGVDPYGMVNQNQKEVYFDTCNGDVSLLEGFVIGDDSAGRTKGSAYSGYIKDSNGNPAEGVIISFQSPIGVLSVTDHNGFFHFWKTGEDDADIIVMNEQGCSGGFNTVKTLTIEGVEGSITNQDLTITEGDYDKDFYANVIVPVKDCDGQPVQGVRVALSGTKYKITDSNGNANFKIRNYSTRDRSVRAVVMNNKGCYTNDCADNCQPCMPTAFSSTPSCYQSTPTVTTATLTINIDSVVSELSGLKSGGRYEFAIIAQGDCGRISAAYPVKYIDIPKTQVKGNIGFCSFNFSSGGIQLPSWVTCIKILRSINLNNYELQWKVDKVERTGDGKIKLTIQSLNDYNSQYFFQTNTTYQWVKNDRVEFIFNGDGEIFDAAVHGILNYQILSPFFDENRGENVRDSADFFNQILIQDDGRLDDLKEGAIIELQRKIAATENPVYHSICVSIPVINGSPVYTTSTFETFDTFLVNRVISSQGGSFVGTFEHHSPSDFWGEKISDIGKRYVANPFENERRFGRNISINSPTVANFFDSALVKKFNAPEHGDITAMHITDGKIILAIGEHDSFLAQSADELVRVGGDGVIRALPPDAVISDAEPKISGQYGCQYDDIGSVYFGDGYATFVDSNKMAYVRHDYNVARNVSKGRTETYFRKRCQQARRHNSNESDPLNKFRWATGMDWHTGKIFVTLKKLRDKSVYNYDEPFKDTNDTIIYHPEIDQFLGFASFTPEFYSHFDLDDENGCSFVTFSKGQPFIHPVLTSSFNEFFGITCDEVVGITLNQNPEKAKMALAMENQSILMWFASKIRTESTNFISEIPAVRWRRENGKWSANFLFNKNSRGGLYGNAMGSIAEDTRGSYISITLVKDNTDGLKYNTIDPSKRKMYNETDLFFIKYSLIEQTGFTNNL